MADVDTKGQSTAGTDPVTVVDQGALLDQIEQIKKAQAGSDRAYQESLSRLKELEAENEKLKKEKMSAQEKAEYELARKQAELDSKAAEIASASLGLARAKLLGEKKIDMEWEEFLQASSEDELAKKVSRLDKLLQKEVGRRVNETLAGASKPRTAAETGTVDYSAMSMKELNNLARQGKL